MTSLIARQREKSNYENTEASKKAIHSLLHTDGLTLEPSLRKFMEYMWNTKGGITKAAIETISATMTKKKGKGYGVRTIEKGISLAKKLGLVTVENERSGKTGYKLCAWKIIAPVEILNAYIEENAVKSAVKSAVESAVRLPEEIPCGSKDEAAKNEPHKTVLNLIKQDKEIKNRLSADKQASVSNPFKFIKPEIVEIVKSFPWHENEQPKIGRKIQAALKDTKTEMTEQMKFTIIGALKNAADYIEKKQVLENSAKKYNYIYQCVKSAINGYLTKHEKKTDESGKMLGVVKHEHYFKTEKKPTLNDYIKAKHGGLDFDDFGNEPERERKILSDDEVIINSDSQPKTTNEGRKIIRSDAGYLPDWFGEDEDRSKFYDSLEEKQKAPSIVSMEAKLNAFREGTQPRKVNNLWG